MRNFSILVAGLTATYIPTEETAARGITADHTGTYLALSRAMAAALPSGRLAASLSPAWVSLQLTVHIDADAASAASVVVQLFQFAWFAEMEKVSSSYPSSSP